MEIINGVDQDDVGGGDYNPDNVNIDGGSIDGVNIGVNESGAGFFTSIEASTDPIDADGVGDQGFNDARYALESNNLSDLNSAVTAFGNIKQVATEVVTGVIEKATTAEVVTGTDTDRAVTPAGITARMAVPGAIGGTTPAAGNFSTLKASIDPSDADGVGDQGFNDGRYCLEANNLSDIDNTATAFGNIKQVATDSATGVSELATDVETVTGTATNRVTTPANITAKMAAPGTIGGTTPAAGVFTIISGTHIISCHNATGSAIAVRSVCYISGDQSGVPQITKAQANAEANAKNMLVVTMAEIANGNAGNCAILGPVTGFSGLTPGAIQYLSDDTAGAIEETATTTSTEIVRIIGYAFSATVLWFGPDISYIEVA